MKTFETLPPEKVQRRHAEILGQGPRILPLPRQDVAGEVRATTDRLVSGINGPSHSRSPIPTERIPEIMFTLCKFPDLWQSLMDVTIQLQGPGSTLPLRYRKLAILRTAWLCQAPYVFGEHVGQAKRLGFTVDEIRSIRVGSQAEEWQTHERAILRAVEELHADAMVGDATWSELSEVLDERSLFELLAVVGQFTATAYFQNALRLRLEQGNNGLAID